MADYALARDFVIERGDALDVTRIECLLGTSGAQQAAQKLATELKRAVGSQGGFAADWSVDAESVDATCLRLDQLSDLGAAGEQFIERAVNFLSSRQAADGSIAEFDLLVDLAPSWANSAQLDARIYCTANAGFWLARSTLHRHGAEKAAVFLAQQLDHDGDLLSFPQSRWLAAMVFAAVGDLAHAELLHTIVAATVDDLGPSALARLASCAPTAEVSNAARFRLTWRQEPDGRWASEDGDAADVGTTILAVRALLLGERLDASEGTEAL